MTGFPEKIDSDDWGFSEPLPAYDKHVGYQHSNNATGEILVGVMIVGLCYGLFQAVKLIVVHGIEFVKFVGKSLKWFAISCYKSAKWITDASVAALAILRFRF